MALLGAVAVAAGGGAVAVLNRAMASSSNGHIWGGTATVYNAPTTASSVRGHLANNQAVLITCTTTGPLEVSPWGERTSLWDGLSTGGYVSDAWVFTGRTTPVTSTRCPGVRPSQVTESLPTYSTSDFYVGPGCPNNIAPFGPGSWQSYSSSGGWSGTSGSGCVNGGAYQAANASGASASAHYSWTVATPLPRCTVSVWLPSYYEAANQQSWTVLNNGSFQTSSWYGWQDQGDYATTGGTLSVVLDNTGPTTGHYPLGMGQWGLGGDYPYQVNASTVHFHCHN